jgi:glycosyltransferase involved in cell wall biosynthesis
MQLEGQSPHGISFIVPAYDEQDAIESTIERLHVALAAVKLPFEIIVVDDGSHDETAKRAARTGKASIIRHPLNSGYGRALKSGIAGSRYDWIGIVDADGSYPIEKLPDLVALMNDGFDMAVAFRTNVATTDRWPKRGLRPMMVAALNLVLGAAIKDPNSGFRLFRRGLIDLFGPFLCNTFSFTTSLTIFTMGHGNFVGYAPITYAERTGRSKVRHFRDSLRMFQLILEGITFYNPLKFYFILAALLAVTVALPAAILYAAGLPLLALGYLIFGCACALLGGMGMLGDINRIAAGLTAAETVPSKLNRTD